MHAINNRTSVECRILPVCALLQNRAELENSTKGTSNATVNDANTSRVIPMSDLPVCCSKKFYIQ